MGNDNQSYGSYLGRVFSLIIVGSLILLAVWFVVQLATGGDDTANSDDTTEVQPNPSDITAEDLDAAIAAAGEDDSQVTSEASGTNGTADTSEQGMTLSTNTDELPDTGAAIAPLVLVPTAAFIATKASQKRRD